MRRMIMWASLVIAMVPTSSLVMARMLDIFYWDPTIATTDGGLNGAVSALAVYDNKLIAAGFFSIAGGDTVNHIAAWDGTSWSPLGSGLNGYVSKLENFSNQIIAIGEFDSVGGIAAQRVAAWDGNAWAPLDSGLGRTFHAWTMVEFNGELIVACVDDLSAESCQMARWDGQEWSPMSVPGWAWDSPVSQLVVYHGMLVSTGYSHYSDQYSSPIAVWTGDAWSDIGLPEELTLHMISDVLVFDDELIVSGSGSDGHDVVSWDGSSWSWVGQDLYWETTALGSDSVRLYLAQGTIIGGIDPPQCPYAGEVRCNDGSIWWGVGSTCGWVSAMTYYQGSLVVGGSFTEIGGYSAPYISILTRHDSTEIDSDDDGVVDSVDNCLNVSNQLQTDSDADGVGDACDNCPVVANMDQADTDSDGVGDACCCFGRVGDANADGEDEPTIGDISSMIDAKFITGTCGSILPCLSEADMNQSAGANPTCNDITIGDISILIDYLFITGPSLGLPDCE